MADIGRTETGNTGKALAYILLAVAVLLPLFLHLGKLPIQLWDESRLAINALEMSGSSNWLVTTFNGEPDLWNTKPPLMIWLQAGLMRLIGYNEWAVRLPSALAGLATVLLVFFFSKAQFKSYGIAVASCLVLVTSRGYINTHVTRSGDYDALLVLWVTMAALVFFWYLQHWRPYQFYLVTVALILAALTKGVAGLLVLPAMAVYTLLSSKAGAILRRKEFYIGILAFLVVVPGYYALRELSSPGYLQAVAENELGGRYLTALEGHQKPWFYYFLGGVIFPWTILLPFLAYLLYKRGSSLQKQFCLYGILYIGLFLLIISSAKTKLSSYDAPVYPIIALVAGIGLYEAYRWLSSVLRIEKKWQFGWLMVALVFAVPYFLIMKRVVGFVDKDHDPETRYGYLMRDLREARPELKKFTVLDPGGYNPPLAFYIKAFNREGYSITSRWASNTSGLAHGELVAVCDSTAINQLRSGYSVKVLHQTGPCLLLQISSQK